jgi:hypothetical protein
VKVGRSTTNIGRDKKWKILEGSCNKDGPHCVVRSVRFLVE